RSARPRSDRGADRQSNQVGLQRRCAGAGGAASGVVRLDGNPANRRRARAHSAASVGPELSPGAGHGRSSELLGDDVFSGAEGFAGAISKAFVAGGPADGAARGERWAAARLMRPKEDAPHLARREYTPG